MGEDSILITALGQALALGLLAVIGVGLSRQSRLDPTITCLGVGFGAGLSLGVVGFDTGIRASNLGDLVFFVILPVLVFEAAWHLRLRLLGRWLVPVMLLATLGIVVSAVVSAALIYWAIGHPSFPWIAGLLAGAILAATDPVAVVSQLKRYNAPEDLGVLFEGESLFNDATAVVLFSIILSLALGTNVEGGALGYLRYFAEVFFGGILVGLCLAVPSLLLLALLTDAAGAMFVLFVTAFGSFYVAEHLFQVSGIMAVMVTAMATRIFIERQSHLAARQHSIEDSWSWLGLSFNSVLFVVMGLTITVGMFTDRWLAMLIAIGAALVARASAVTLCAALISPLKPNLSPAWSALLVWGGLRGAVAIALVLSLPTELDYWWTIQAMVFGVVLFSLLVQSGTNGLLIRRLGGER